jgi:hypothetical protein
VSIQVERIDRELFETKDNTEVLTFLEQNEEMAQGFLFSHEYPDLKILADRLYGVINDRFIDTLYNESIAQYKEHETGVSDDFNEAFSRLKALYPELKTPRVQTMVSGLYNDLYISNDLIVIGIDYYIGETASFKPVDLPDYILQRYQYEYLVPSILGFYVDPLIKPAKQSTLLSEMITYGKIYYLISQLLPCVSPYQIMGYSSEVMDDVLANQEIIWANFIENQWLYETNEFTKKKFIGERPNVYEIGEKCPGRIGAWLGWQIVSGYVDNNEVSVKELLLQDDHHMIFTKSKYKPKNI